MRELILGCGNKRTRVIRLPGFPEEFQNPVTLDIDPNCGADVVWDLSWSKPLPFPDDHFDSISASEVLEHIGQQGDYRTFFRQFEDYWRVLKPGGYLAATCPRWDSPWAWGDPGHTRIISLESLVFLDQDEYAKQCGVTPMTDYRWCYKGNFKLVGSAVMQHSVAFILQAKK